jgi:HEAT repeat protein
MGSRPRAAPLPPPSPVAAPVDPESVARAIASALDDPAGVASLTQIGDPAFRQIADRFPGPIEVQRRDLAALPPLSSHGPLLRLVAMIGDPIAPYVLPRMTDSKATTRFYAALAMQEARTDDAIQPLAECAFDPDSDVRGIAMRVLETYAKSPKFSEMTSSIRAELESTNQTRRVMAARAVSTLRDTAAVSGLIKLLDDRDKRVRDTALEGLCSITGQQLGFKASRWRSWYDANGEQHRVDWIIASLSHRDGAVRQWAADELRRVTGQPFAFPVGGGKRERDLVINQWKQWWASAGPTFQG